MFGVLYRQTGCFYRDPYPRFMQVSHPDPVRQRRSLNAGEIRTLGLASLGGALEFYDFVVFVFFTAVIGQLFFPPSLPDWLRQLQTFGIFAAGYLARPLGGIVMAHYGDKNGRKRVFTLSVLVMAISTLLIGLLPTYQSIGIAAPLLLLVMRMMQGIAIGGEAPGGWVFVAEHAPPGRVGLAVGLLTSGLTLGIFLGSLVAAGLNVKFSQPEIAAGLWRLPFFIGGIFGIGAMLLRRWLSETPVFEELRKRAAFSRELPLQAALRGHGRAVAVSMVTTWMLTAAIVVVILMTPALLQKLFLLPPAKVQLANLAATAALSLSVLAVGVASDRFGVRRVAVPMLLLLITGAYALYWGAGAMPSALLPLYVLAAIGTGAVVLTPIVMVRAFPPQVRFSGVSFSYNVVYAIFGGITPPLVLWLAHVDRLGPAHYIAAVTILGLLATLGAPTASDSN
jgi:MFS family permease